jgi:hypothetical protein
MPSGKTAPPRYEEAGDDEPDEDDDDAPLEPDDAHGSRVSWRDEPHVWSSSFELGLGLRTRS